MQTQTKGKGNTVDIRKSHPNLYWSILMFGFIYAALGINFIFTTPTFQPYPIPYPIVGAVFLTLGMLKIILLNFIHNLDWLRKVMGVEIGVALWWSIGGTATFIQGKTSLQLPILYVGLCFLEVFLLREPFVNPATSEKPEAEV